MVVGHIGEPVDHRRLIDAYARHARHVRRHRRRIEERRAALPRIRAERHAAVDAEIDAEAAARVARDGVLLDARAPERFRGETEPIDPVAGHVPGAVNAPTTDNALPDGRFLTPVELRKTFHAKGIRDDVEVGAYCGSGVTATHELLALHEAGFDAALYVGSWSEWVTDPTRPVATGP